MDVIDRITKTVESFVDGTHENIRPGMPFRIPDAWEEGDAGAQGDLVFVLRDQVPAGYVKVETPTEKDRQLVRGNTQGARHCLDSLVGVELYHPADWSDESLDGPYLRVSQDRTVLHPTHGPWTIPAGLAVQCEYPRVYDQEQQRASRAKD